MRSSSQTFAAALVVAAGLASFVSTAHAAVAPQQTPALAKLLDAFPGVHMSTAHGAPQMFYGVPMTQGDTPDLAAQQWLADFEESFGAGQLDLVQDRNTEVNYGKFNAFVYNQTMDGLPVEMGTLRLLVLNAPTQDDPTTLAHRVVMATARVATRPAGGFAQDTVNAQQATKIVQQRDVAKDLDTWNTPEMCVYFGQGDPVSLTAPVRCWKFAGWSSTDASKSLTFFVDAATGNVVFTRDNVSHADVIGRIRGWATPPNNTAPSATNPPSQRFIPEVRVSLVGESGSAYTDASGFFRITRTASTPVTLSVSLAQGHWVAIADAAGNPVVGGELPNYPTNNNQIINLTTQAAGSQENVLSQVNTFLAQNDTHNFFRSRSGDWNRIDIRLPANVNINDSCNAFFRAQPLSTNFFSAGGGCTNTGWGMIVNHEYGHFIVNRLQLGQGAFGEGFGDSVSILIADTPVMGAGFFDNGAPTRDVDADNVQAPCDDPGGEPHYCGEILGGIIWEMRNAFVDSFGLNAGRDELRQLFVDWALVTAGAPQGSSDPVDANNLAEWLTVDDTDGLFCNGTPHHPEIVQGFGARNIQPSGDPAIEDRVRITVDTPAPEVVPTGTTPVVAVHMVPENATIVPGTQRFRYRTSRETEWITVPLTGGVNNLYSASLPQLTCTDAIEYYFLVDTDQGSVAYPTPACGGGYFFVRSQPNAADLAPFQPEDFEAPNPDWTESFADGAVDGRWIRAIPLGSSIVNLVPSTDTTDQGVNCWVTKNNPTNGAPEDNDVDAGAAILTSPRINLSAFTDAIVTYNRWFTNGKGTNPFEDTFVVQVSDDDGATWHTAQTVGPAKGPNTVGGWITDSTFTINFSGAHTAIRNRIRFVARDDFGDSLVEAAIDDLRITGSLCQQPCDSIDYNRDGLLPDTQDIADFLSVFGGGPCSTNACNDIDFNNDNLFPDTADIEALLTAFSGGVCD